MLEVPLWVVIIACFLPVAVVIFALSIKRYCSNENSTNYDCELCGSKNEGAYGSVLLLGSAKFCRRCAIKITSPKD